MKARNSGSNLSRFPIDSFYALNQRKSDGKLNVFALLSSLKDKTGDKISEALQRK